jgi:hypothetical protein
MVKVNPSVTLEPPIYLAGENSIKVNVPGDKIYNFRIEGPGFGAVKVSPNEREMLKTEPLKPKYKLTEPVKLQQNAATLEDGP